MFENFVPKGSPDNRHSYIEYDEEDDIIIGGTCQHIFILPMSMEEYEENVAQISVFYKQGLYIVLEKSSTDESIYPEPIIGDTNNIKVVVNLSSWETTLFKANSLNTTSQLKLIKINDDVLYTKPRKVRVEYPIDQGE